MAVTVNTTLAGPLTARFSNIYGALANLGLVSSLGAQDVTGSGDPVAPILNASQFYAPLTHSLILTRGTGNPTFTRATSAWEFDNEGKLILVPSGAARFGGARMVRNLLATTGTLSTQNVTTVATSYTLSFYGTGSVTLSGTATGTLNGTGASNRVQTTVTATAGTLTLTVSGSVTDAQLENVTGQADQTASEYVSAGVLSAPFHGAGVDGVKWFDTHKSLSAISESSLLGNHAEGARTNSLLHSRDLTNAAWAATNITPAKTATGIDNAANSASTLTAGAADATILQTLTLAAAARSSSAYVKRRTGTSNPDIALNGTFVGTTNWNSGSGAVLSAASNILTVQLTGGDTFGNANQAVTLTGGKTYVITANLLSFNGSPFIGFATSATGATVGSAATSLGIGYATYTPPSDGTYYIVIGTNGADTSLTVRDLSCRLSSFAMTRDGGTNWIDIGERINGTTWTRVKIENTSVLNPSVGFKIATSGDAIDVDVCQDEAGPFITSPIITTTAAVTRNTDALDYATTNVSANSTFAATWNTPTLANSTIQPIIGTKTSSIEGFGKKATTNNFYIANPAEIPTTTGSALTVDTFNKFAGTLNGTTRAISANGGAVTSAADNSTWTATKLRINGDGWGGQSQGYLKDVYIWSTALTDAQLQQVTS